MAQIVSSTRRDFNSVGNPRELENVADTEK